MQGLHRWACALIVISSSSLYAGDEPLLQRIASRTNLNSIPAHTHERAGTAKPLVSLATERKAFPVAAAPSIQSRDGFGYVNGMTFGTDYVGRRPGRIFPGLFNSRDTQGVADRYRSDGPIHVPDPLAAKPFRKAVIEAREEKH